MKHRSVAIVDDDALVCALLERSLQARLGDVHVAGIPEPVAPAGFDVYIVDTQRHCEIQNQDIVTRIQAIAPQSLVLVYTESLDPGYLRKLLMQGCEGAFHKGSFEEVRAMLDLIEAYFVGNQYNDESFDSFGGTVRAIYSLVREWNLRISAAENDVSQTHNDVS
ncbi:MAG: response regulator transcription factor [Halioglobus sp.]|nr:response regulator transcription factor [Halioglobus sp.]